MEEAKQEVAVEEKSIESAIDEGLDAMYNQSEPSTGEQENEPEYSEESPAEAQKTEKSEDDDGDIPQEFHKHPAWQRIMKQRDEARAQLAEQQKPQDALPEEVTKQLEEFKKVTSSPEFLRAKWEAEGLRKDVIERKLRDAGHDVQTTSDLLDYVADQLNVKVDDLGDVKDTVRDIAKIADVIAARRVEAVLKDKLGPISEQLGNMENERSANDLHKQMVDTVKSEGILDFKSDIEPELVKYMNANPNATQDDVMSEFSRINHRLSIDRLKSGKKQAARDDKKKETRSIKPTGNVAEAKDLARKEGETDSSYFDRVLDAFNM